MFDKIWKEQISQETSKVGFWKPKTEITWEPKTEIATVQREKEGDCNRELKEYTNKLRNMSFKTKGNPQFNRYWEKQNESGIKIDDYEHAKSKRYLYPDDKQSYDWEKIEFRYNPVPEEIACIALKYLKELEKDSRKFYNLELSKDYGFHAAWQEYKVHREGQAGTKIMKMYISKNKAGVVSLQHYFHAAAAIGNYDEVDIDWR